MHRPVSATLVVLMHSTLLWSSCSAKVEPPPPAGQDAPSVLEVRLLPSDEGDGDAVCDSYRGVGVRMGGGGEIIDVAPGGPADRAGVRLGDRLLNEDEFGGDRYPNGTVLVMRLQRGEREFAARVVVRPICQAEVRP